MAAAQKANGHRISVDPSIIVIRSQRPPPTIDFLSFYVLRPSPPGQPRSRAEPRRAFHVALVRSHVISSTLLLSRPSGATILFLNISRSPAIVTGTDPACLAKRGPEIRIFETGILQKILPRWEFFRSFLISCFTDGCLEFVNSRGCAWNIYQLLLIIKEKRWNNYLNYFS